jgi:hypothetical protein
MSKICDRNYKAGSLYTTKMIGSIPCCPSCSQPAECHGKPVEYRVMFWALHGSVGSSSKSIAQHMATGIGEGMPPSDADDRSRCIKLLELVPEWLPRLDEMRKYDRAENKQETFVMNSSGISADTNTWSKQIPLMVQEGSL